MNKRQKKKLDRKLGCKHFSDYRERISNLRIRIRVDYNPDPRIIAFRDAFHESLVDLMNQLTYDLENPKDELPDHEDTSIEEDYPPDSFKVDVLTHHRPLYF
jgi:hypothetical protein